MIRFWKLYAILVVILNLKLNTNSVKIDTLSKNFSLLKYDPRTSVVSLHDLKTRKHFCTGSIVAARWVLTSATCLLKKKARHTKIVGATTSLKNNGNGYAVDSFVINPYFKTDEFSNNLALVKTRRKFRFHRGMRLVQIANITEEKFVGSVIGWNNRSINLDVRNVTISNNISMCLRGKFERVGPDLVCLETKVSFDEGAPLVYKNKLIGVYSSRTKKCKPGKFYWFTKVQHHQDWLFDLIYYCGC